MVSIIVIVVMSLLLINQTLASYGIWGYYIDIFGNSNWFVGVISSVASSWGIILGCVGLLSMLVCLILTKVKKLEYVQDASMITVAVCYFIIGMVSIL